MVNGYSIVTYQRPLKASDEFDKIILTNKSQPVIWAIGPLNERKEVSFHTHYTKGDRFIDFGRPAKWNCPMPEGGDQPIARVTSTTPISLPSTTIHIQEEPQALIEEAPEQVSTRAPSRRRNHERRRGESSQKQEVSTDTDRSANRNRQTERRDANRGGEKINVPRQVPTPAPVNNRNAWEIPAIQCYEPEDGVFYAQMGPTGGKRGYPAITGKLNTLHPFINKP